MSRPAFLLLLAVSGGSILLCADGDGNPVFRADVSLVRVDAQVTEHGNRTLTGLHAKDFVLLDEGQPRPIRSFATESMPVDVLLLLDVSVSMRPHIERIASAAHQALRVLGKGDRVAIMVFDRSTRLRLKFRDNREDVEQELESLLNDERFNGGTDITRGLLDAAHYIGREGRHDARRAIVIVTDDQTERSRNESAVSGALLKADAVLCALIAPDAMRYQTGWPGGTGREPQDGPLPGGPLGGPLGGIIFGRRGPYGGPGPVYRRPHTQSAGTAEIARQSGGDSMPLEDASSLETTLARIRQRYALFFYSPEGVKPGQVRNVEVELADATHRRYPDAEVRYRREYIVPSGPVETTAPSRAPAGAATVPTEASNGSAEPAGSNQPPASRRPAVNEGIGSAEGPLASHSASERASKP